MKDLKTYHRFLDEAGDTTFYGKGKVNIVGTPGVSKSFILGMVKFKEPLEVIRDKVLYFQENIKTDAYYLEVPSIQKRIKKAGFYFHATDDPPEVRKTFYELIKNINCSFEAVVGRKFSMLYEKKHNGNESEFYADLLSHLLKNKLGSKKKLVLNIAARGKSTKNKNLQLALNKATKRFRYNKMEKEITANVVFNVQSQTNEPLLNIADYFCWAIQRVFERGEMRYYNFLKDKISLVIDLYDSAKYDNWKNYYSPKNVLTAQNKISPLEH